MDDQFSYIVSKVLSGEASTEEKKALQTMLLDNSEYAALYNQLKEYWDADVKLERSSQNEIFESRLLEQLNFDTEVPKIKFRKLYFRIASAAAVLFFAATCSLAYLYTFSPRQTYTYSSQSVPVNYTLADGSVVKLNKNSSISFQSDFGKKRREVKLNGEAFFEVTKDKTRPFSVEALETKTEVLGTSFNVRAEPKTGSVVTTLVEGSVKFSAEDCKVILTPGEEVNYNGGTHKYNKQKIDPQLNTSWITGRFKYRSIPFSKLIEKLEHIYSVKIQISDSSLAKRVVSASFLSEQPIEEVLSGFEGELKYKSVKKNDKLIEITSKNSKNVSPM